MEIKTGTTWNLKNDVTGETKKFLQNIIDTLGYKRSACGRTVYLLDDNGNEFRLEQHISKPWLWYLAG